MADYVYRVVYRPKDSDLPWEPLMPWNSRTGRPYVKESVAKGIATQKLNRNISRGWDQWEYDVQRSPVKWENVDG